MSEQMGLFDKLTRQPATPRTEQEWFELDTAVLQSFTPHGPIDEDALFSGRTEIAQEVIDTVFQRGCHAIIYGERGVGKTSFANNIKDKIFSRTADYRVIKRNCTAQHDFDMIWRQALDDYELDGKDSSAFIPDNVNAYDIYRVLERVETSQEPVIVIDEFDRVKDDSTFEKMADLIKLLSDSGSLTTIIIVGVGDSVHQLFGGHLSIHRNTRQILMPKMKESEILEIFEKRQGILNIFASNDVLNQLIALSQGYPGYAHLLGQFAYRAAVERRQLLVEPIDLKRGIERCVEKADEIVQDAYDKATRSTKPVHYYKQALTAFAMAAANSRGYFRAASVKAPFSKIMESEMDIPHFSRHLTEFQQESRGPVLIREGKPKSYEYKFANPLLKPFAIIAGIRDGIITLNDFSSFSNAS